MKKYIIKLKLWLLLRNPYKNDFIEKSLSLYNEINYSDNETKKLWELFLNKIDYKHRLDLFKKIKSNNEQLLLTFMNNTLLDYSYEIYPKYHKYHGWKFGMLESLLELYSIGKRNYLIDFFENGTISNDDKLFLYVKLIEDKIRYESYYGINLDYFFHNYFPDESFFPLLENLDSSSANKILEYYSTFFKNRDNHNIDFLNKFSKIYLIIENNLFHNNSKIIEDYFLVNYLIQNNLIHRIESIYLLEPENLYKYIYFILKDFDLINSSFINEFLNKIIYVDNLKELINEHKKISKLELEQLFNSLPDFALSGHLFDVDNFKNVNTAKFWFLKGTDYFNQIEKYELNKKLISNLDENKSKEKKSKI